MEPLAPYDPQLAQDEEDLDAALLDEDLDIPDEELDSQTPIQIIPLTPPETPQKGGDSFPSLQRSASSPTSPPTLTPPEGRPPLKRQSSILSYLAGKGGSQVSPPPAVEPARGKVKKAPKKGPAQGGAEASTPQEGTSQPAPEPKKRYMPFFKKMPNCSFSVDAFCYGPIPDCTEYFLTHFHSDHYTGLSRRFDYGQIYCTPITARLVIQQLQVDPQWVTPLEVGTTYSIKGAKVTFIDANHCPGACLILFEMPDGKVLLHTGDFRANSAMPEHPLLKNLRIDILYLDTTYCKPSHTFPPQADVLRSVVTRVKEALDEDPTCLVLVGSYSMGKERVFLAVAEQFGWKICVSQAKYRMLACLGLPNFEETFTTDPRATPLHVVPLGMVNYLQLSGYLERSSLPHRSVLGIRPTGWTFDENDPQMERAVRGKTMEDTGVRVSIFAAPYSEHSSFEELRAFVQATRPVRIIATVGGASQKAREEMNSHFASWMASAPNPLLLGQPRAPV